MAWMNARFALGSGVKRRGEAAAALLLAVLFAASVGGAAMLGPLPIIDDLNEPALTSLLQALGATLAGVTGLAFAALMFVIQTNLDRLPQSQFVRYRSDPALLFLLGLTFVLAIGVALLSLMVGIWPTRWILLTLICGTTISPVLAYLAVRRALALISPMKHVVDVVSRGLRSLSRVSKFADHWVRVQPLPQPRPDPEDQIDYRRAAFFRLQQRWDQEALGCLDLVVGLARAYAGRNDRTVSSQALLGAVQIWVAYIQTKGRTFFVTPLLGDTGLARDSFFAGGLESLKRAIDIAIANDDELLTQEVLRTFSRLAIACAVIQYPRGSHYKEHASLPLAYLKSALYKVVQRGSVDTAMIGVRAMGVAGVVLAKSGDDFLANSVGMDISPFALPGAVKRDFEPLTLTVMEQLRDLILTVLVETEHPRDNTLQDILKLSVLPAHAISKARAGEKRLGPVSELAPIYSATDLSSLPTRLVSAVNKVAELSADDEAAKRFIRRFEYLCDGLYEIPRELLPEAAKLMSPFYGDIFLWTFTFAEMATALAGCAACDEHLKPRLERHASWLLHTMSFVDTADEKVAGYADTWQPLQLVEKVAHQALSSDAHEVLASTIDVAMGWGLQVGVHWPRTLAQGLVMGAAIDVVGGPFLKDPFGRQLSVVKSAKLNKEAREMATEEIKEQLAEHSRYRAPYMTDAWSRFRELKVGTLGPRFAANVARVVEALAGESKPSPEA